MDHINVRVDPKLKREFKVIAAEKGLKQQEIILKMITEYVKKNKS